MKFTGERFVPGIDNEELTIEHMQRYRSVLSAVAGKTVVDIASGEGYGSDMLASVALHVTGIDISSEAVKNASEKYRRENLDYMVGDVAQIPLETGSVDVVVSFETIEHVSEEKQKQFLAEAKRILKADGVLIISTPNKKIYSDKYNYHNEFHIKEFYREEFEKFVGDRFANIAFYNQYDEVTNVIESDATGESGKIFKAQSRDGKYYIVVASDGKLPELDRVAAIREEEEYSRCKDYILRLQNEEEERNLHIKKLDTEISEKNLYIDHLQETEIRNNEQLQKLDREKLNLEDKVSGLEQKINEQKQEINEQKQELSEREQEINRLEQELRNKQGHIELLLESERELERLKEQMNRRLIMRMFPVGSKRRLLAKLSVRAVRHPLKSLKYVFTKGKVKSLFSFLSKGEILVISRWLDDNYRGDEVEKQELVVREVVDKGNILDYEPLDFVKQDQPKVSIVIPVYNQFEYTYNCLRSILENSGEVSYEIILANDCSTDFTTEIEKIVNHITVITNQENLRFLKNCNYAASYAKGQYILFLNNDTQVQPNWLQPLVELIERDEKIGMVGSKLVYADGRLQEAGGILWRDGSAWNYGNGRNPEDPEFNYVKEVDYISGAAIMIKADLWREIGGFDERFVPAYCEDSDLAFEVRRHGYKVMFQPLSVVVHFEGISNGTDTNSGQKSYQVVNQKKFYEKWKNVLETEHFNNAEHVFRARDRQKDKPVLVMVDHYVPQFDKDAGSRTVFQYLKLFVEKGFDVKFIGDNFYKHEPYTTILQQMGIEVLYGPFYANNWQEWVLENVEDIDYVFLNRPHISVKYIGFFREKTHAKIIYYGHDLHFLREQRRYELEKDETILEEAAKCKENEFSIMRQSDAVYYPSSIEVEEIAKIDQNIYAKAIIAYIFDNVQAGLYDMNDRRNIMFVGGFIHKPNVDAVVWFVKEVFPKVVAVLPDIKLYIIGSNPSEVVLRLADEHVIVKGFVSDQELESFYKSCRIAVVPLRYGAGIKGKVVEAMRFGMPVVTTSVGTEGIKGAEDILCVADDAEQMGEKLIALYSDTKKLQEMSARSCEYIQNHFSAENAWNVIEEDFS